MYPNTHRQNLFNDHARTLRQNEENYRSRLAENIRIWESRTQWATVSHLTFMEALRNDYLLAYQQTCDELVAGLSGENDLLLREIELLRLDLDATRQSLLITTTNAPLWVQNYDMSGQGGHYTTIPYTQEQPTAGSSSLDNALEQVDPEYRDLRQEQ